MTTEMTNTDFKALKEYHDTYHAPDPFLDADPADLVLPRRVLVQAQTQGTDSKMAGQFYDKLTGEYKPSLLVAVLSQRKTRALFEEIGSGETEPVCRSDDAVTPRASVLWREEYTGPTCKECPFSQWGSGKGDGQACSLSFDLICYDLDDKTPFMLRVKGASIDPWRKFVTQAKLQGIRASSIVTEIGATEVTFKTGTKAWVLTFRRDQPLDPELASEMLTMAGAFKGAVASDDVKEDEQSEPLPFD